MANMPEYSGVIPAGMSAEETFKFLRNKGVPNFIAAWTANGRAPLTEQDALILGNILFPSETANPGKDPLTRSSDFPASPGHTNRQMN